MERDYCDLRFMVTCSKVELIGGTSGATAALLAGGLHNPGSHVFLQWRYVVLHGTWTL